MKQSLKQYNTFGVDSYTSNLFIINQISDIQKLLQSDLYTPDNILLLGAGSNLLMLENVPDQVILMRMMGIRYEETPTTDVNVTVAAGVSWHHLVQDSLSNGYFGLENLALIPGLVGAAPIQNIGAYGVELCDRFVSLTAINLITGSEKTFYKDECQFAYRDSLFKRGEYKNYLVISVQLKLTTKASVNIDYKVLKDEFSTHKSVTPEMVFNKVCEIRNSKLPDPVKLGNAGSFFKNPVVDSLTYKKLKQQFPDLIAYSQPDDNWKLAAGWMIEKAGLKGYRSGNVGVHTEQALVLVNYDAATGIELAKLAQHVQGTIMEVFSIMLEPEVTIITASGVVELGEIK